ncbi:MAG TPA: hypothetical protein VGK74_02365 [Symbiobacteriaceae bacterium]|jgi:hypothetical protein
MASKLIPTGYAVTRCIGYDTQGRPIEQRRDFTLSQMLEWVDLTSGWEREANQAKAQKRDYPAPPTAVPTFEERPDGESGGIGRPKPKANVVPFARRSMAARDSEARRREPA